MGYLPPSNLAIFLHCTSSNIHIKFSFNRAYKLHFVNVASINEQAFELDLPYPIQRIVGTYATLCDSGHPIQLIQLLSIAVYNINDELIFYIQELKAVASPNRSRNPVHG